MLENFFPQRAQVNPTIYAYRLVGVPSHDGYLKIGYTERDVVQRIYEQTHTAGLQYEVVLKESAMCTDGSCFTDHDVHAMLETEGIVQMSAGTGRNEAFVRQNAELQDASRASGCRRENQAVF